MKFYNRQKELKNLQDIQKSSLKSSKMSVIVGRRRIGKTKLIKEAYGQKVYLFVSKKDEALLCGEFVEVAENALNVRILGEFKSFKIFFEYLMQLAQDKPFTLVIDEFQEFLHVNSSIYSDMQNIWDEYKDKTKMNLVLSGSIYSLMKKIFEDKKEPLFGRADNKIHLKSFSIDTLKEILKQNCPNFTNKDLLSFYIFTGGVAKYVEIFVEKKAFSFKKQLDTIFDEFSLFLEEGKNLLIEEFGKEYATYFSILSLIANSKTSRSEIEGVLGRNIGGYLEKLENDYTIIKKIRPIFAKKGGKIVKYEIADNYLNFWFRFVYKYKSAIEIENFDYVKDIVKRDFSTYSGRFLERYFAEKIKLEKAYSLIGSYWERANQNEIDLVAVNELDKKILVAEVKINSKKINLDILRQKAQKIEAKFQGFDISYRGFSLDDM
ncbi:MAG: ATPase [Proteobacteria bacterium]|nr:MAG: ATPase [Pseudomonadota bacterium]